MWLPLVAALLTMARSFYFSQRGTLLFFTSNIRRRRRIDPRLAMSKQDSEEVGSPVLDSVGHRISVTELTL